MNLGAENRTKTMGAVVLGVLAILAFAYEFIPMFSGPSATPVAASQPLPSVAPQATARRGTGVAKKIHAPANLDPTLKLQLLAASEQTVYTGLGRNIFVSQAEVAIPTPKGPGVTDAPKEGYKTPTPPPPPPIPLKFFGFANQTGETKRVFLVKGEDVFIAGEGDIVDRRYKVVRITPTSVEIQDVVTSGPPQSIPLTQG